MATLSTKNILSREITELQNRLGVKIITVRNLKSKEDCRAALVKIAKSFNVNKEEEISALTCKFETLNNRYLALEEENAKLRGEINKKELEIFNLSEDKTDLQYKNNNLHKIIGEVIENKKKGIFQRIFGGNN